MAYEKLNLTNGTVLNEEHLAHIEAGIANSGGIGEVSTDCEASGEFAHAEGSNSKATGECSHTEGINTTASGTYSHAEGLASRATSNMCHAEGYDTWAYGNTSHAEGSGTIAAGKHQHVQGAYNIEDTDSKYAHIVGNGHFDYNTYKAFRSNAHTLDWAGVPWFAGDRVMLGGTGMDDADAVALMPVFVPQELTEEQKAQARANIGVDAYIEQVFLGGEW